MSGVLLTGGTNNILFWGVYIIFFGALIYFMAYRPQQKQKKEQEALLSSMRSVTRCSRLPASTESSST